MSKIRLYMAPLKGVTDHVFRNTFASHFIGFGLAMAPFIPSKQDPSIKPKYVKDVLPEKNERLPVIPQILSKNPADFINLANYLYDLGYKTVNWNLGCPSPMVAGKQRGAGMLPNTERILTFLDEVVPGINGSLSIKVRLGWKDASDIFRLLPAVDVYPLSEIIIHPRTGLQRYQGTVDLDAFEACLAMTRHRVVYNGDIKTVEDFRRLSRRFPGIHAWMIGRWCLADPFLPECIVTNAGHVSNKTHRMKAFHTALFEAYLNALDGPSHVLNKMKGLWRYFSLSFSDCRKIIKKLNKSRRTDEFLALADLILETNASK